MKSKSIFYVAAGFLTFAVTFGIGWYVGNKFGQQQIQSLWDSEKLEYERGLLKLADYVGQIEANHRDASSKNEKELNDARKKHEKDIAAQRTYFVDRLRQSESRSKTYDLWAKDGSTQGRDLAGHAARLDRSLEEGRSLVEELRGTLVFREEQLRALGSQIIIDRELIKSFGEYNELR